MRVDESREYKAALKVGFFLSFHTADTGNPAAADPDVSFQDLVGEDIHDSGVFQHQIAGSVLQCGFNDSFHAYQDLSIPQYCLKCRHGP